FANDLPDHRQPGVVFIGVDDKGNFANLSITDELLRNLAGMRSDGNILPIPTILVQKRTLKGKELAVVMVYPSDAPPVRYHSQVWVRVGPRRARATAEEERRLAEKRRARDLPFDLHPIASATLDDLDLDYFRRVYLPATLPPDVLGQNQRSIEHQLTSMRLATVDAPPIPTVLGILSIGKDPRQFIPGDYIQFLRIDGAELTDPIKDQKEIDGPLPDMLRLLDEKFQAHISVTSDPTASIEIKRADYPVVALQQLARNAIMHRYYEGTNAPVRVIWFNDRIEISNPGGPFGQVSRQNFGQPGITDYRNPHLAAVMKDLGYVQRFGIGIQLARKELEKNGNPPPDFEVDDTNILVTVRRRP
ncbi:MAG: ATP-binding protein, partial [Acidobacteriota bacterium]